MGLREGYAEASAHPTRPGSQCKDGFEQGQDIVSRKAVCPVTSKVRYLQCGEGVLSADKLPEVMKLIRSSRGPTNEMVDVVEQALRQGGDENVEQKADSKTIRAGVDADGAHSTGPTESLEITMEGTPSSFQMRLPLDKTPDLKSGGRASYTSPLTRDRQSEDAEFLANLSSLSMKKRLARFGKRPTYLPMG